MIKKTYNLCKIFGIPIKLDISVIILAIYLAVTLGDPIIGILAAIGLLLSIALHELGHSVVAMAFGCKVRDITLMLLGGCATMVTMPRKAWQEFLMALAGPAVSLLLALIGLQIIPLIPGLPKQVVVVFMIFGYINLVLGVFNLAPAFPMDGGRILRSFLQQFFMTKLKATWIASRVGRFLAIVFGLWTLFSMFTGNSGGYLFIRLLLAFYIYRAAEREYRIVQMEEQGGAPDNPFAEMFNNFSFGGKSTQPPKDDGQVVISPPPYKRSGSSRTDIHKE
ncbi:MAG: site-2 protease family protein [Kiritimatiellae bacterium]|jgi:Zn-dependent protease|nr:site-2 protease family protein [Kiritimatiellia bacterium]